jgi:hypothetical protein
MGVSCAPPCTARKVRDRLELPAEATSCVPELLPMQSWYEVAPCSVVQVGRHFTARPGRSFGGLVAVGVDDGGSRVGCRVRHHSSGVAGTVDIELGAILRQSSDRDGQIAGPDRGYVVPTRSGSHPDLARSCPSSRHPSKRDGVTVRR